MTEKTLDILIRPGVIYKNTLQISDIETGRVLYRGVWDCSWKWYRQYRVNSGIRAARKKRAERAKRAKAAVRWQV
jgi:hypothetical protein